jgi:multicomponent Na+:H+ antiporter subunit E
VNLFVLNAALALGWAALLGEFTLPSLIIGFAIGYAALWAARPLFGDSRYFGRLWRIISLAALFVYELVASSLRVVWDVVTPMHRSRPGVIEMPLSARSDEEILLVANLISLTPGSLSLDVAPDRTSLYVHVMFLDDVETARRDLKEGLERKVIEAMR